MKTLLILSPHPEIAETIRAGVNPGQYRVIHRVGAEEAEPLLAHGMAQACVLDVELTGVQGIWLIEKLRRCDAKCPIIVYAGAKQSEWEEEAYLRGVSHVLSKPVRPRALNAVLDRLFAVPSAVRRAGADGKTRRSSNQPPLRCRSRCPARPNRSASSAASPPCFRTPSTLKRCCASFCCNSARS